MGTLEKILSQAVLRTDAIRDRVTGKSTEVLGSPAAGKGKAVALSVVGVFEASWTSAQAEIDAINGGTWFPATADFIAVFKNSRYNRSTNPNKVPSTFHFVGMILEQKVKSIKEIRIVTHGNTGTVGFEGEVVDGNVFFSDELDLGVIAGLQRDGIIVGDSEGDEPTHQW